MQIYKIDTPMKKIIHYTIKKPKPAKIILRSNFDSGNMGQVQILNSISTIAITPAYDCSGTSYQSHAKGWFYFAVSQFPLHLKQKFIIRKMHQLSSQSKFVEYFKPVSRYASENNWDRIDHSLVHVKNKQDDIELHFEFNFTKKCQVFFAYSFPFTFQQCEVMLKKLKIQHTLNKSIYYNDQIIIRSFQGRPIHLLTITSNDSINVFNYQHKQQYYTQPQINEYLFQQQGNKRCLMKNNCQKQVIIISARVHPGQTPSSHTFNGLLTFLLSKDARAYKLRQKFIFKLIPMLNPDGVAAGHYRMDCLNQNLNRYYLNPDPIKQPSIFAVKNLAEYYKIGSKLSFYIDLHAHPQKKGNFIYGNNYSECYQQAQTQLFAKLLSINCIEFDYDNSSFSKNQMNAKDKYEDMTKQGCGRVVFKNILGLIFSYTLECGYTCSNMLNEIVPIENFHRKYQKHSVIIEEIQNIKSSYYQKKNVYFSIKSYQNLGKSVLVSILDLYNFNPASRIPNTSYKTINNIRSQIVQQICKVSKQGKVFMNNNVNAVITQQSLIQKKNKFTQRILNRSTVKQTYGMKMPKIGFNMPKQVKIRNQTLPKMGLKK